MPCFNDSGGPSLPGHRGRYGVAFPLQTQGRRPQKVISELFTQPAISLSTLHPFGYPRGARLASGWRPTLAGRDSYPQGPFERFPRLRCHFRPTSSLPPSPGFAWRTPGTQLRSARSARSHLASVDSTNPRRFEMSSSGSPRSRQTLEYDTIRDFNPAGHRHLLPGPVTNLAATSCLSRSHTPSRLADSIPQAWAKLSSFSRRGRARTY